MATANAIHQAMPLGIVVRRLPGVTRWAAWSWRAVAVLPGAPDAQWRELRREGDAVEFHAGTLPLTLWAAETEAYVENLKTDAPSIYVVMRATGDAARPYHLVVATASPYEAQDYCDNGEDLVEKVPMTEGLRAWVAAFTDAHHVEEPFVKRRRDKTRVDRVEDGKGDARIRQDSDVYRAPTVRQEDSAPVARKVGA